MEEELKLAEDKNKEHMELLESDKKQYLTKI